MEEPILDDLLIADELDESLYTTHKNHKGNIEKILNIPFENTENNEEFELFEMLYLTPEETEKLNNSIDTKYIIALLELIYAKLV